MVNIRRDRTSVARTSPDKREPSATEERAEHLDSDRKVVREDAVEERRSDCSCNDTHKQQRRTHESRYSV